MYTKYRQQQENKKNKPRAGKIYNFYFRMG